MKDLIVSCVDCVSLELVEGIQQICSGLAKSTLAITKPLKLFSCKVTVHCPKAITTKQ
jgi:hypothetical protein